MDTVCRSHPHAHAHALTRTLTLSPALTLALTPAPAPAPDPTREAPSRHIRALSVSLSTTPSHRGVQRGVEFITHRVPTIYLPRTLREGQAPDTAREKRASRLSQ